ncbi:MULTISPECIES: ABC transporter substrate-binding protein [Actinokineospora]|uniref:Sugar ABC transporter substrate-binding protein n=1 Tax=Actinokineospora fastidiosa TaxID=1816 RepID=A0A918LJ43_9PSEU|nr:MULTISPECIES: sugar ABC transporter substrate-binding protein [Actinokineospora]UVS79211.1 Putative ABC transporter substrate-binding protein YesO [Actinokineospora sp. UTMC 2448]GGS58763.1 sugar ABC transporter substrate-binding protein [Actinokineospora fastidiosa]
MKKHLAVLSALVAASVALAGCGGGPGGNAAAEQPADPADLTAEISYGVWGENVAEATQRVVADFNRTYPNVKVNVQVTPYKSYWTKLQTQAGSGTMPDVLWMNGPNFQLYASNGKLAPITGLVDAGKIDPANYPQALDTLYTYEGVRYGVPKDFDTIAVFYNKKLFAEAGVAEPAADWTVEQFTQAAKDIRAKLKSKDVFGVTATLVDGGQQTYYNTIAAADGHVISPDGKRSGFDSPEAARGLQVWADLIAADAMPSLEQDADTSALSRFTSGRAAMFWSGSWDTKLIADSPIAADVAVAPLPRDKRQATVIHGLAHAISADTENKAAAEAFLTYLAGKEAAVTFSELSGVISAHKGTQDSFLTVLPDANLRVFLDGAENYAVPYPVSKNSAAWGKFEPELLPDAFSGAKPVAEAARAMAEAMNQALEKE